MDLSIVVPTYNGGILWNQVVKSITTQSISPEEIIVIDSSSNDSTLNVAKKSGFRTFIIKKQDFNHGGTRNLAYNLINTCDVIVFLTQDAILDTPDVLAKMIEQFADEQVVAVCGRQLPHDDANPLATHARLFNYPSESCVKSVADIPRLGIKTVFMSNSFAAYRSKVFFELGGFPDNTILAEDMYLTAKMVQAGYKVAYCAEASVRHSHNYSPWEEFRRYFDTGVFHACEPWIRGQFGGAGGEGIKFIHSELAYLKKHAPLWIPRALLTNVCKLLGYKLGQKYSKLPIWLCKQFSMYKSYWLQNNNR